jgi:exopolysaccharide production protein ExoY
MDQPGEGRAVPHPDPASVATSTATEERNREGARGGPKQGDHHGKGPVPLVRAPSRPDGTTGATSTNGAHGADAVDTDHEAGPPGRGEGPQWEVPHQPLGRSAGSPAKRALDLGVTIAVVPVALLLGLVITLLVVATSRGPALFVQERVGLGGRRFRMVKFRTMHVDAEERLRNDPELWDRYVRNGFKLPAHMDSRVTPIGRFLRRSSLDELPQLLNVLQGHMSLVGPRPVVPRELEMYGAHAEVYLGVKPGLTGWWQVNGRAGVVYPERVELDRYYAESWTLWLDVRILLRTPLTLLRGGGAY